MGTPLGVIPRWPHAARSATVRHSGSSTPDPARMATPYEQVTPTTRIERGPRRKRDVATLELLDNERTASHYRVGNPDAYGAPIVEGEPMDYVDWFADDWVWYVYRFEGGRYQPVDVHPTEDAARKAALELAP